MKHNWKVIFLLVFHSHVKFLETAIIVISRPSSPRSLGPKSCGDRNCSGVLGSKLMGGYVPREKMTRTRCTA